MSKQAPPVFAERARDVRLEEILHDEHHLGGWAEEQRQKDREARGELASIGVLPYNPDKYPEQRIDTVASGLRPHWLRDHAPDRLLFWDMRRRLGKKLGATSLRGALSLADEFVSEFTKPQAGTDLTRAEQLRKALDAGQHVGLLCSHLDGDDVAIGLGALQIALRDRKFLERSILPLNKLHSRESRDGGEPVTKQLTAFTEVVWTVPKTDNAVRFGIFDESNLGARIVRQSLRYFKTILSNGTGRIISLAPAGTGVSAPDETGVRSIQTIAASFKLMGKLSAYIPISMYQDNNRQRSWIVRDVVSLESKTEKERIEHFQRGLIATFREDVEQLTGDPTIYKSADEVTA